MVTVIERLEERLHTALRRLGLPVDQTIQVVPAADTRFGDYQTNAGMVLAKERKENPRSLAGRIAAAIEVSGISKAAEVAGPGFINFRLERKFIAAQVIQAYSDSASRGGQDGCSENANHRIQLAEYRKTDACRAHSLDRTGRCTGPRCPIHWARRDYGQSPGRLGNAVW